MSFWQTLILKYFKVSKSFITFAPKMGTLLTGTISWRNRGSRRDEQSVASVCNPRAIMSAHVSSDRLEQLVVLNVQAFGAIQKCVRHVNQAQPLSKLNVFEKQLQEVQRTHSVSRRQFFVRNKRPSLLAVREEALNAPIFWKHASRFLAQPFLEL
ncbi:Hypothetical_protein [Hexamita inflata]|uniref:Hypothetical_protein n=1 Tax=Hexamita inflata TaxID=28002 RepID=A0AA86NSD2_9EUKA|nr:Hypothetical protein HINF_LOCUS12053 [Hexamita inflata]CAI9924409.1 Hypothetical protein HINF_LOCUS12054 [Hexamita inflata]